MIANLTDIEIPLAKIFVEQHFGYLSLLIYNYNYTNYTNFTEFFRGHQKILCLIFKEKIYCFLDI